MNYHYPLDDSWSKQEVIDVVNFFALVEQAYEKQVQREDVLAAYHRFKRIVPSKSEEKTYFREFERASGYACFPVVKKARNSDEKNIRMK
ncbi:UPF0223 family protein [Lentibacillus cibarius]|uniref:UPF0223 protein FFL34_16110 n=1 Tax=Lentibacillus cibarius TaxID=2583219 RepID=A0A549YK75_9BACI|nr:UPF0223 family protein [Lentibacillus cibarius]TMN23448.1 UPF0223 family protein [Lentibacillus cibarius]TRM12264.1 UPF0223 family protein [Lentibacillus cibarius]